MTAKINVTKSFLPPIEEYVLQLKRIWANGQLTNQGPLLQEFETKAKRYLGVDNFQLLNNGTMALQIAMRALGITEGEIITTPFSYVATTSSILWERCEPVFVDIELETFCIDAEKIEAAITPRTKAILAVHVFGFPCNIETIEDIAHKHKLKVIYDAAHAFGVTYKGKSLLDYGDISICSFHATKLFHTIEGGAVIAHDRVIDKQVDVIKRFGHNNDEHITLGINAKASEFQAAMGLCCLDYIDEIIEKRKRLHGVYSSLLKGKLKTPPISDKITYNYAYYPVLFKSEKQLQAVMSKLESSGVFPRRYFYPSLNLLPYLSSSQKCPVSEDVAKRVVCLPLYETLEEETVQRICEQMSL